MIFPFQKAKGCRQVNPDSLYSLLVQPLRRVLLHHAQQPVYVLHVLQQMADSLFRQRASFHVRPSRVRLLHYTNTRSLCLVNFSELFFLFALQFSSLHANM